MDNEQDIKEKARKIVALLPKKNCGKCGYENCGKFAVAVASGKASSYDCHKSQSSAREIEEIAGITLPERNEKEFAISQGHHHYYVLHGGGHHHGHHHGGHGPGKQKHGVHRHHKYTI